MGAATLNGVDIEWREAGKGHTLLFVHGFPFNSAMWGPQLTNLPAGWRGIAPDLRGFGASGEGAESVYTMELFARDLNALLDHLGVAKAVICGQSMGGYITFEFWRLFRERVRALVLTDTRAGPDTADAKKAREHLAQKVDAEGITPVVEGMLPKLISSTTRHSKPGVVQQLKAMMQETPPRTMARALRGMAVRPDSEPLLRTIDVPALVLVGAEDAITTKGQAEFLARGIRGAGMETIDDAGHMPPLEQPQIFNRVLATFLSRLPQA
jgi:pimeloyl-ACP methyl ester carboxylesterase